MEINKENYDKFLKQAEPLLWADQKGFLTQQGKKYLTGLVVAIEKYETAEFTVNGKLKPLQPGEV